MKIELAKLERMFSELEAEVQRTLAPHDDLGLMAMMASDSVSTLGAVTIHRELLRRARLNARREDGRHYHVNSDDGTDACRKCGRDLRDSIHMRVGKVSR